MTFGSKLRELRNSKKMTQEELGKILNVSKVSISGYENDTREPDKQAIKKLAELFNVSTDYLLGVENSQDEKDLKDFLDENLEKGMTYANEELTDEDKEKLKIALTQIFWKHHKDNK
ncbi:helix-turn-helix transcriptional regulator [Lactobacillus sp. UCMA15818]|uniref:helix-turn-helix domain-containing protein n=1 Tax=Lactobacillaceae TaxID=33958 RepID=UPI0025AFFB0D|nr:helix-turn-helix transcriptional regulator [Lactobacillus sp. UCMA15818]MDN2452560.1 helix-turn-helix transcriptional regulator [Lactobacillus sp. UCMA15818]